MPEELTEDRAAEIRDQEKRKLQGVIDDLRKQVDTLTKRVGDYESAKDKGNSGNVENDRVAAVLEKLDQTLSQKDKSNMSELSDIREILSKITTPKESSDVEELKAQIGNLTKTIQEEKARNQKIEQENAAKTRRLMVSEAIRSFGKPVIEELINGDTEEEILESVKLSAQRYDEIVKSALNNKSASGESSQQENTPAGQNTTNETQTGAGELGTLESSQPQTQSQQQATGAGPTPQGGPSRADLIAKLNELPPNERVKFLNENREVLSKIAEEQYVPVS